MKGLFVLDLDGTALGVYDPYMRLPVPLCRFLDELVEKDWQWAFNTAWGADGQWQLICDSPVTSRPLCMIAEFGRRIAVPKDGGIRMLEDYEARHAAALEHVCGSKIRPLLAKAMIELPVDQMVYYGHLTNVKLLEKDENRVRAFLALWLNDPDLEFSVSAGGFQVRPSVVHKGLGIEGVIDLFGCPRETIVAAGDSFPDISMMKAAGFAVCPSNAEPCVRAVAAERGCVGEKPCCDGIIEAFKTLAARQNWF